MTGPTTISDLVLDAMEQEGWTPTQVRALVAAYREVMQARARVLERVAEIHTDGSLPDEVRDLCRSLESTLLEGVSR
jgi:acyl-[acyl carrier protein]--UDP-N-acetylglucosamine O-acyltransferase